MLVNSWLEAIVLNKPVISIAGLISEKRLFQHISKKASGFDTFVNFYSLPKSIIELEDEINKVKNHTQNIKFKKDKLLQNLYNWDSKKLASREIANDILTQLLMRIFLSKKIGNIFFQ